MKLNPKYSGSTTFLGLLRFVFTKAGKVEAKMEYIINQHNDDIESFNFKYRQAFQAAVRNLKEMGIKFSYKSLYHDDLGLIFEISKNKVTVFYPELIPLYDDIFKSWSAPFDELENTQIQRKNEMAKKRKDFIQNYDYEANKVTCKLMQPTPGEQ